MGTQPRNLKLLFISILALCLVMISFQSESGAVCQCKKCRIWRAKQAKRLGRVKVQNSSVILKTAYSQLGRRYVWGGDSPRSGFDCSGLTFWVYRRHGINLPRVSYNQLRTGRSVRYLKPGDLVFFRTSAKSMHVGIYIGNYSFIHSSKSFGRVMTASINRPYWCNRFIGARRVM